MKSFNLLICFLFVLLNPVLAQKKITVRATPADATISVITVTNELKQMGIGTAVIEVPKKSSTTIVLQKAGFADLKKVYSTLTDEKLPKEDFLTLKDRMIILKVWPDGSKIFVNNSELEKGFFKIIVKEGERVNVEVKKSGFVSIKKVYANQSGTTMPPIYEDIKLTDRVLQVVAYPSDAKILVDNQIVGSGNCEVVVPLDRCVNVKISKDGYIDLEKTYCNKEGIAELPVNESFTLQDRMVTVRTSPEEVSIKINGRYVAKGEYNVKVAKGETVEVLLEKEGFVPVFTKYCNQDNAPVIPLVDQIDLLADESFTSSTPADFVNTNNIIEVNPAMNVDDAWKTMSQIVMTYFDILEITDKATGYMRTAWTVKTFPSNTIRTRLIVKVADSATLKYVVKLSSEASGKSGSSANDDSLFSEWRRVLETYKNIVTDMQTRLK